MSVQDKVLALLKSKEWVSSPEIEAMFPSGIKGHYSWPQRLRGLREKGYTIEHRTKQGTKNLSEWHLEELEPPKTEQEEVIANANLTEETRINLKVVGKQMEFCGI